MIHVRAVPVTLEILPQFRHEVCNRTVPVGQATIQQEGIDGK